MTDITHAPSESVSKEALRNPSSWSGFQLTGAGGPVQSTGGMLFSDAPAQKPLFSRVLAILRRERGQPPAVQIQVGQREVHTQPLMVLP